MLNEFIDEKSGRKFEGIQTNGQNLSEKLLFKTHYMSKNGARKINCNKNFRLPSQTTNCDRFF